MHTKTQARGRIKCPGAYPISCKYQDTTKGLTKPSSNLWAILGTLAFFQPVMHLDEGKCCSAHGKTCVGSVAHSTIVSLHGQGWTCTRVFRHLSQYSKNWSRAHYQSC